MAKEPTTVAREVTGKVTNPVNIQWPHDPHGFTTMLRKEGVRAVGRIFGDAEKLAIFISTLKVLGDHAKTKLEDQRITVKRSEAAVANRRAAEYERSEADKRAEVARLKRLLAAAEAQVEAKVSTDG